MRDWEGTIVSRITPLGHGGVGIVRLSGPRAYETVDRFVSFDGGSVRDTPVRYLASIVVRNGDVVLDRGLGARFEAPRSFTGEDVVELHLHGNPLIVDAVVERCIAFGCRPAEAGEFTMRAVVNGRIDMLQAEAVAEAIEAETVTAVTLAQRQLGGELSRRLQALRARVVEAIARLELELDFAEEGYSFFGEGEITSLRDDLRLEVDLLLRSFRNGARLRHGPRLLLLGRPNAGKSSFFNSVLGYSRALVSDRAGTTRDYLEERLVLGGLVLHLVDTAGLRSGEDDLEAEGIGRALGLVGEADFVLYLVDVSDEEAVAASDREIAELTSSSPGIPIERVWTKTDRVGEIPPGLHCSLVRPESIQSVLDVVAERCRPVLGDAAALVTQRQARHLEEMRQALTALDPAADTALVSADLRQLLVPLGSLTGEITNEDVLDSVFRGFCIGK